MPCWRLCLVFFYSGSLQCFLDHSLVQVSSDGLRTQKLSEVEVHFVGKSFKGSGPSFISISPDGKLVAVTGNEKKSLVRIWDIGAQKIVKELDGFNWVVPSVTFSRDSRLLATSGLRTDPIRIWDTKSWKVSHELQYGRGIISYADKGDAFGALSHNRIDVFDTKEYKKTHTIRRHLEEIYNGCFCPSSSSLALANVKGEIQIIDWKTEKQIAKWAAHDIHIRTIRFSQDGKWLGSAGQGESIARIWDGKTGEFRHTIFLERPFGAVRQVDFSPDGELFAIAGEHVKIPLYSTSKGEKVMELVGHNSLFECLAFSPDGSLVVAGAKDGNICVWKLPKKGK